MNCLKVLVLSGVMCLAFHNPLPAQITIEATEQNVILPKPGIPAEALPANPDDVDLDPFVFGVIQHRSMGIREAEADAYHKVLDFAIKGNYQKQQQVAKETVARHEKRFRDQPANARIKYSLFVDLFQHPEEYTGELLYFRGYARKLVKHAPDPDNPKAPATYEAWIYSPDSQHNPIVVVCHEIPPGMPTGGNIVETIEVTGYFFKVMAYQAQDTLRAAPMLIAKKLEWVPRPQNDFSTERIIYFLITGGFVLGLIVVYWTMSRRAQHRLSQKTLEPEDFDPRDLQQIDLSKTEPAPTDPPPTSTTQPD